MSQPSGPVTKDGIAFGPLGTTWVHLCVDMQRMFAEDTDWQTPWMQIVLPRVVQLVEMAPERTVFTRFIPAQSPEEAAGSWKRYYERWPGMTLDRLDPGYLELVPEMQRFVPPAQVIDKHVYSPWLDGVLDDQLKRRAVDTVVISGAETEVCVLAAVVGAIDLGYRVIIATDAVCSSADQTHDAALELYENRFGMQVEIATVAQLLEEKRRAG